MLGVPSTPKHAYYFSAFGDNAQRFGSFLLEMVIIVSTVVSFVCLKQGAEYGAADLFLLAIFLSLTENVFLPGNEGVLVLLLCKILSNILKHGFLCAICDLAIAVLADVLSFARADKTDCIVPDCLSWFLYDFANVTIIILLEWQAKSSKR